MVPGDMYEWSRGIFAKKSKFHDAGGPDTVVSPATHWQIGTASPLQITLSTQAGVSKKEPLGPVPAKPPGSSWQEVAASFLSFSPAPMVTEHSNN